MSYGRNYNYHREAVISAAQDFTTSWADLGSELDMKGFSKMGIFIELDVNSGQNMRIRALAKLDPAGTNEYNLPIRSINASDVKVEPEYTEFNIDGDANYFLEVNTFGLAPYVQLQVMVGTDGGANAQVDSCEVTKIWI